MKQASFRQTFLNMINKRDVYTAVIFRQLAVEVASGDKSSSIKHGLRKQSINSIKRLMCVDAWSNGSRYDVIKNPGKRNNNCREILLKTS